MKSHWVRISVLICLISGIAGGFVLFNNAQSGSAGAQAAGSILLACSGIAFLIPYIATTVSVIRKREWGWLVLLVGLLIIPPLDLGILFLLLWYSRIADETLPVHPLVSPPTPWYLAEPAPPAHAPRLEPLNRDSTNKPV